MKKIIIPLLISIFIFAIFFGFFHFNRKGTSNTEYDDLVETKTQIDNSITSTTEESATVDIEILEEDEKANENSISVSIPPTVMIDNQAENPYTTFFDQNNDYIGWIEIEQTRINYPVVKGSDNDFYLEHNFNKEEDKKGAIYMDYRNFGQGFDNHTIIYGHHMKDGSMFGDLSNYMDQSFFEANREIIFTDLHKERIYKIISVYYEDANPELLKLRFDNDYSDYVQDIINRSMVAVEDYNPEIHSGNLLTLITCSYELEDSRYFVHAIDITEE